MRICNKSAEDRQTDIEALLPSPAPIGIVERSVYRQPGNDCEPSDKKIYKNDEAALWCIFREAAGASGEMFSRCGFMAATSSGSRAVTWS